MTNRRPQFPVPDLVSSSVLNDGPRARLKTIYGTLRERSHLQLEPRDGERTTQEGRMYNAA